MRFATRKARAAVAVVSVAAVATACSSGHKKPPPTTTIPPTTTTSTTVAPPPAAPLTGLPQTNPTQLKAPAVVVKIDNIDQARPQTGLNSADIVYEEEVEGGLTRLAAVYQSVFPVDAGPVRSGRLTDKGIADDLNHPVFVFSGTNAIFLPILDSQPLTPANENNEPGLFRAVGDNAPHNLYISVASAAKLSTKHTAPSPLFTYASALSGSGIAAASAVSVHFPAALAGWTYDAADQRWLRSQNGTPDVLSNHTQISATNVVVLFVNYIKSAEETGEGVADVPIPEGILTGEGRAIFFSQGKEVQGTWSRSSLTSVATYKDATGAAISIPPGNTWIELAPLGTTVAVTP